MITVAEIKKSYKGTSVLEGINMQVEEGEFVSIIGPSGCGKSTLVGLIAGLDKPDGGKMWVEGKEIDGPGLDRIVVFQNAALFPWMSVHQNVAFGLKNITSSKSDVKDKTDEILKKVHLYKNRDHYPHELSGGMRQRVSIARSLIMDPKVLLMDEPFSALDEQTRILLQSELQQIWSESRKTVLFVTHNIREAVKLSNRIVVLGIGPGRIIDEVHNEASFPRKFADPYLTSIEERLFRSIEGEIEKRVKEEMGDEYEYQKNTVSRGFDNTMGGGI